MLSLALLSCISALSGNEESAHFVVPDVADPRGAIEYVLAQNPSCQVVKIEDITCRRINSRDVTTKVCFVKLNVAEAMIWWDYTSNALVTLRRLD